MDRAVSPWPLRARSVSSLTTACGEPGFGGILSGMGLLDGDIAGLFGTVFGSFYLDGTLSQNAVWVPDGEGGGSYQSAATVAVKYQIDQVDERTRAAGGYSQDDVRFIVLQQTGVVLDGDSELTAGGRTYLLRNPQQDPARSYWMVWGVPKG
jgi:hypothetical protein